MSRVEEGTILIQMTRTFRCDAAEAENLLNFGRWISLQAQTDQDTTRRLLKRMSELGDSRLTKDLLVMIAAVGKADTGSLSSEAQTLIRQVASA